MSGAGRDRGAGTRPHLRLFFSANMVWVALQGEGLFQVGRTPDSETCGFAQGPGALPTDGVVLVGEAALEGHEDVAAGFDVIVDFFKIASSAT